MPKKPGLAPRTPAPPAQATIRRFVHADTGLLGLVRQAAHVALEEDSAEHYNVLRDIASGDWLALEAVAGRK